MDTDTDTDTAPPVVGDVRTFSQAELDAIVQGRVAQERRTAETATLEALGVESLDAARAVIDARKAADTAAMSDAERASAAATADRDAAAADRAAAASERLAVRTERALTIAGLSPATAARLASTLGLEPAATDDELAAAVTALATESPELFSAPAAGGVPSGVPKARQPNAPAPAVGLAAGAELAKTMFPPTPPPTFTTP